MAQTSFTVTLRHSLFGARLLWALHGLLALAIVLTPWQGFWRIGLLLLVGFSGLEIWRWQVQKPVIEIRVSGDSQAVWLRPNGTVEWQAAQLQGRPWASPWLTVFSLMTEQGASQTLWVLPDCCPAESFRQLRVWLRGSRGA